MKDFAKAFTINCLHVAAAMAIFAAGSMLFIMFAAKGL